jgi:hypothetical protein
VWAGSPTPLGESWKLRVGAVGEFLTRTRLFDRPEVGKLPPLGPALGRQRNRSSAAQVRMQSSGQRNGNHFDGIKRSTGLGARDGKTFKRVEDWGARDIVDHLRGLAQTRGAASNTPLKEVEGRAVAIMASFRASDVATVYHSYAKMGRVRPGGAMLGVLEGQAIARMGSFGAQQISMIMWSHGKMKLDPGKEMLGKLEEQAVACTDFAPQGVANTLWAYATLGIQPGEGLVKGLEGQAASRIKDFEPQAVANTLWRMRRSGYSRGRGL